MKMMAMALVAVAMTAGFSACSSSSDDDNNTGGGSGNTTGTATAHFYFDLRNREKIYSDQYTDYLTADDLFNTTLTYIDENGKEVSEKLTGLTYDKTITFKKLPCTIEFATTRVWKSDDEIDLTKNYIYCITSGRLDITSNVNGISHNFTTGQAEINHCGVIGANKFKTVDKLKAYMYRSQIIDDYKYKYIINADGTIEKAPKNN